MWNGANYPMEYETDVVDPSAFEPLDVSDLVDPWNVRVDVIAKRLNDLLVICQQQQDEITALRRRPGCAHQPAD